jgi:hypothetical protein
MSESKRIASAGNVLPGALASLRTLGFVVTVASDGQLLQAKSPDCTLIAEDLLALLGLAKLHELRGSEWCPTDEEVEAFLALEAQVGRGSAP